METNTNGIEILHVSLIYLLKMINLTMWTNIILQLIRQLKFKSCSWKFYVCTKYFTLISYNIKVNIESIVSQSLVSIQKVWELL